MEEYNKQEDAEETNSEEGVIPEMSEVEKKQGGSGSMIGSIIVIIVIIIGGLYFWSSKNNADAPADTTDAANIVVEDTAPEIADDVVVPEIEQ
ncbi:MAG: hypothetical protein ABIG87_00965 [Patescibacteria group bacterium]